ncbi:hypothetical protein [Paraburkholderia rhizosphaerae]|uniref:hypothetical protein n=1 Tax=Paraburkholderia rhizosphaerae TaxID=480658 RepID=UPI00106689CE|nr:hypothetical protein [Paraburkholderia rhizosphaerae]
MYLMSSPYALLYLRQPAEAADCAAINAFAERQGVYILASDSERQVIGKGRSQFYSAPDENCKITGVFIVPKERVDAYYEYGGYISVIYINVKSDSSVSEWVKSGRLRTTDLGSAPHR